MEHSAGTINKSVTQDYQYADPSYHPSELVENDDHVRTPRYDATLELQDIELPAYSIIDPLKSDTASFDAEAPSVPTTGKPLPELPIELWDLILRAIDDHRALYACLCTCSAFRDLGRSILEGRQELTVTSDDLSRRLVQDPFLAYLLTKVTVEPSQLPAFAIEFCGRLHNVREFRIFGYSDPRMGLGPGMQSRLALTRFTSVTSLFLSEAQFATSTDCMRFLCAFQNLRDLEMYDTRYVSDNCGSVCVMQMPFAQVLKLKRVKIQASDKCPMSSIYMHLLFSPCLAKTLEELVITTRHRRMLDGPTLSAFHAHHCKRYAELAKLHKLSLQIDMHQAASVAVQAVLNFLDSIVASNLKFLSISFYYYSLDPESVTYAREDTSIRAFFQKLDDFLDSPRFPCLESVHIALDALHAEDIKHILPMPLHRLPFPALSRWELLTLEISNRRTYTDHWLLIWPREPRL
ncbi:hypothetical protein CERSUDRAFT_99208 [Gelatoporia subvermispora B]|uniref:F-box domain-containing protein n=1 Tax=Ceriporiopsis subvermispora (strain B) TaxID=914234 RepID=M2PBA4_CERS8|nr:hypothetical protein CERSUDRAFT_99208 [Gelatoporia subvermispora B]